MTESEWRECREPQPMLAFLRNAGKLSERKARLFAVACCRRIWHLMIGEKCRKAVEVSEQFADGLVGKEEWQAAVTVVAFFDAGEVTVTVVAPCAADALNVDAWRAAMVASRDASDPLLLGTDDPAAVDAENTWQAALLRDLFGPLPFRPVILPPSIRTWQDGTVVRLGQAAYDNRQLPAGTLEQERLMVLADALEEAGARDQEMLRHLREPGVVHVRGCHVVDLLLGKT
jgi:hypothetical protein